MYVREKKIRRGIGTWDKPWKVYSYWQVVKGVRGADGKVKQKVVHHLGRYEDRESADLAARVSGLLCGAKGCGNAATEELTWKGMTYKGVTHTTPVEFEFKGRDFGALVCPEHLEEWHQRQIRSAREDMFMVYPAIFTKDGRMRRN